MSIPCAQSSKSANYCNVVRGLGDNIGLMLLCEVSLGDMYELLHAEYMEKAPKGKQSTMGCGRYAPMCVLLHLPSCALACGG